jgi:hypothetical protein
MKKICAWCKKDLGTTRSRLIPHDSITHGICEECADELMATIVIRVPLLDFLDNLDAPVVMMDGNCMVKIANSQALELLHKDLVDISGSAGGDVFECLHAKLPEGCGNTIHCDGCTIRNTVTDTYRTGESHMNIPAILRSGTRDNPQNISLLVSTEKVKEYVLLRIDHVEISQVR